VTTLLIVLAIAGAAAAAWHMIRAAFRCLGYGATGFWNRELARTHARRGDVTALEEAERGRASAGRFRRRSAWEAGGWFVLLVVPPLTPWSTHIYAAYAVLWLVPVVQDKRRRGRGRGR
jgi:hypothetical protein